jgi:ubiquinone/menaquinone biosynthesis C-methylase UbiE
MTAATQSLPQQQFSLPTGWLGRIAGWFMAAENRRMNQMAIEWLDVGPQDDVLEVGFGPGHAIELLATNTKARSICGVDPSPVMVRQAIARNQEAVDAGRVRLTVGNVESLPFRDGQFTRVVAVSNFHVWESCSRGLAEIERVLAEGGLLVISQRLKLDSPWPWSSPGVSVHRVREDQRLLEIQGFRRVQIATRKSRRTNVCLVARK